MRVLVCGGRDFKDRAMAFAVLDNINQSSRITAIIHGAAKGADSLAAEWACENRIWCMPYPAKWRDLSHADAAIRTRADGSKYDANAGPRRNQYMIDKERPDLVVALPGGDGTADMVRRAKAAGIRVIEPPSDE